MTWLDRTAATLPVTPPSATGASAAAASVYGAAPLCAFRVTT